ncbi:hypothetical protein JW766_02225 [Candidatus Dojkabacteria bacterium]|nr:hypothetical protein [Candidatus Dojkabacteria bacterium]
MNVEAEEAQPQLELKELAVRYKTAKLVTGFVATRFIRVESISLSDPAFYEKLFAGFGEKQLQAFQSRLNRIIFKEDWFSYLITYGKVRFPWETFRGFGTVALAVRSIGFKGNIVVDRDGDQPDEIDPSRETFGILHFIPYGDIPETGKYRTTLAMGTVDVLEMIKDLKSRRSGMRRFPKYLIGVTNQQMADFAIRRLGFRPCNFKIEVTEAAELVQESRRGVFRFFSGGMKKEEPVRIIIETEKLLEQEADIERARDIALKSVERREETMRQARFEAIQGLVQNMLDTEDVNIDEQTLRSMKTRGFRYGAVGV